MHNLFKRGSTLVLVLSLSVGSVNAGQSNDRLELTKLESSDVLVSNRDRAEQKRIDFSIEELPLQRALQELAQTVGTGISFHSDLIPDLLVSRNYRNATVYEVLYGLLEGTDLIAVLSPTRDAIVIQQREQRDEEVQQTVTGQVTDADSGEPLPGVNVVVQGSDQTTGSVIGAQTDVNGQYSIRVPETLNVLVFTYIGYERQLVQLDGRSQVNVSLMSDVQLLEDVVVVGYGSQQRINLTGAVDQVTSQDLENRPISNLTQGLQGAMPNVNINMIEGKPIHSPTINIRGTTSIGQGGSALILIDGVEGDPSMLNPNDIESISVLKDASSAAIYGARGAFGVVLITTKRPEQDQLSVTYSGTVGVKSPTVDQSQYVTNGLEWGNLFVESFQNWEGTFPAGSNKTLPFSQDYLDEIERRVNDPSLDKTWIGSDGNYRYAHSTDWFGHLFKSRAMTTNHNLSVSGSSGNVDYMVSGRIQDQEGLIRLSPDDYSLANLRASGSVRLSENVRVNNTFDVSSREYFNPMNCCDAQYAQLDIALEGFPLSPLYNPDGTLSHSGAYALGGYAQGYNGINLERRIIRNKTEVETRLLDDRMTLTGDFAFQQRLDERAQKRVPVTFSPAPGVEQTIGASTNWLREDIENRNFLATNVYLTYEETLGERHDLRGTLGYNYEQSIYDRLVARRDGLIFPGATDISLALGEDVDTDGGYEKWSILGGFYRLNYIYDDRYLLELTGRYDGSSKFPENERYAFFPSASVGWRISSEPFWNVSDELINHLQLRASYGSMGNGNIGSYVFTEAFGISRSGRILAGTRPRQTSSPAVLPNGLTWETATTRNLGLNMEMFNGRLQFSGDMFVRETTDMFSIALTPPAIFGASAPRGNYADLETKGWELAITYRDRFLLADKPFSYNIGFNLADHKATITRYNNPDKFLNDYYEGMVVGEIWGYETDGFFTDAADIANHADQSRFRSTSTGQYHPGDVKLRDLDGDGVIGPGDNTADNPGDRRVIGNTTPRYTFGINLGAEWSNFFVSTFFQGVGKRDWYPSNEANFWGQYNRPYNHVPAWHVEEGMRWTPENPNAFLPRYVSRQASSGDGILRQQQTGYLMNAAFLRLKTLQVGYNLPIQWVESFGIRQAQVFFSGENLWSWSPLYKTADHLDIENQIAQSDEIARPNETVRQGYNYPIMRTLTFGVSITF
ncbi:MAG: TonB-dependent receptor [Balneolaceae bacterium]